MNEKNDFDILTTMINGTSSDEMKKWGYELQDEIEEVTLCDVRRIIEKKTGNKYSTLDILSSIKEAGGVVVPRNEDGRYDLTFVDIDKVIEEIKSKIPIK